MAYDVYSTARETGQYAPPKDVDPSSSPIRDHISRSEDIIEQIFSGLDTLEKRLDVALTPVPPQPSTASLVPAPTRPVSHLNDRLASYTPRLLAIVTRLAEITRRIEI